MAEVHIVDIDGEQWDMKDLPLTNKVAALENVTIPELKNNTVKMVGIKTKPQNEGLNDYYTVLFPIQNILSRIKPNSNVILSVTHLNTNNAQTLFYDGTDFTPPQQTLGPDIFYYQRDYFILYVSKYTVSLDTDVIMTLLYTEQ